MKKSELKEYIKKSILEGDYLEDDPKAIDAMDDAMVQDYEEEEEPNKYALDKEEPLEEAKISPDNRVAYLENILDMIWKRGRGNNTVDFKSLAQSAINDMFDEEPMEEDVIAEADKIVEAWKSKKQLTEAADASLEVIDWEELDKYGEKILVKTADGKEEKFTLADIDESELSYHAGTQDAKAYQTYYNADKSKKLGLKLDIWGSPDSPEHGDLEFDYLADNTKKLNEAFDQMEAMYQDLDQVVKNIAHIGEVGTEEAAMLAIEYIAEQYQVSVDFKDFM